MRRNMEEFFYNMKFIWLKIVSYEFVYENSLALIKSQIESRYTEAF